MTKHKGTMDWFEQLFGFRESARSVREKLYLENGRIHSRINNKSYLHGTLTTPSLSELRLQTTPLRHKSPLTVREIVCDAQTLHTDPEANGALFQVASQFNLLEMQHPSISPAAGVTRYARDGTQGPACAVACGAGTVYRNWFAEVDGGVGQTEERQIDCLREFGIRIGNGEGEVWNMWNGYAMGREEGLRRAGMMLGGLDEGEKEELRGLLRIGVQSGVEVTLEGGVCGNVVSQAYCSAMPVGYCGVEMGDWEEVGRMVLEGCYEATLRAGVVNWWRGGSKRVYVTLVGGGVFGNDRRWILNAMERAFRIMGDSGLDVRIVSYGKSMADVKMLQR